MEIKTIGISAVIGFLGIAWGVATYSMDWQREQDQKIADLDKLLERQKTFMLQQQDINESFAVSPPAPATAPQQPKIIVVPQYQQRPQYPSQQQQQPYYDYAPRYPQQQLLY